ncbi:S-layer homology domain-containing protein, partial [Jeotgalibaca porci]|uniref:S-layer homology domain-containing protein n=1 Tax=Jeotgalibaca porci TaxID=1868793 RepID=UPI0035A0ADF6
MRTFSDIENHWAEPTISELVKRQIIHFEPSLLFYPEQKITTEQFVSWLVNSCHARISNQWTYALEKGLAEDYDFVNREKPI